MKNILELEPSIIYICIENDVEYVVDNDRVLYHRKSNSEGIKAWFYCNIPYNDIIRMNFIDTGVNIFGGKSRKVSYRVERSRPIEKIRSRRV